MPDKNIEDVIRENSGRLMSLPGVVGVGAGVSEGEKCLVIFITGDVDITVMPDNVGGYPVLIEKSGVFQAREPGKD